MEHISTKTVVLPKPAIILSYSLILITFAVIAVNSQSGTTVGIKDIFANRCDTFQEKHQLSKNCTRLWELFLDSFSNKQPCAVTPDSYSAFFQEANHTASIDGKSLFWAFTSSLVYKFSDSQPGKYTTIVDLLPGFILNDLKWCWSVDKQDFNYVNCIPYKNCTGGNEAVKSFWTKNSAIFANLSTGGVFAMLNGSVIGGAYTKQSLFFTAEVPAMAYPRITKLHVIIVHDPEISFNEDCSNGTLLDLNETLTNKSIVYSCEDDPPEVRRLQCQLHPEYGTKGYCAGDLSIHHHGLSMLMTIAAGFVVLLGAKY